MTPPADRRYLATHEWHKFEGGLVTIGITHFAAEELADITFVELPKVGAAVSADKSFGEIESVKAASDLYSGVDGTVTEVNGELASTPGLVNSDPYGKGWMIRLKPSKPDQINALLAADEYTKKAGH
jgi:glycine cleavage system H protein